ncbi:MAG: SPOR domain-containing protein [Bacteroidales bacterium]
MIDEYIKELIATNNRVIIPNFGAFLLRATSKNKNKKDLASKVDDIYFSPFLKFNDELLVNHIIQKEGTDQQKALEKINQYIKQIEEKVKKDGIYTIEGLGEFTQDNMGKIQFNVVTETPKTSKAKEEKPTTKKTAEKKKTPPKTIHEKASASKKTTPKSSAEKKEEKEEEVKKEEEKKTTPPQSKGKAQKMPPPKPPKPPKEKTGSKSGSNKGLVLSIAIGLPIVVLFIWAMLNFDSVQKLFDGKDKQVTEQVEKEQPAKEDEGRDEEGEAREEKEGETEKSREEQEKETEDKIIEEKKKEAEEQQTASTGEKKFHIVAGSFEKRQNAIDYRDKLREQGFNAELIGERNGMHAVSYASFSNKAEATKEMNRIKNEEDLQAWLLYY